MIIKARLRETAIEGVIEKLIKVAVGVRTKMVLRNIEIFHLMVYMEE